MLPETGKQLPGFFSECIDPLADFSSDTAIKDLLIEIRRLVKIMIQKFYKQGLT